MRSRFGIGILAVILVSGSGCVQQKQEQGDVNVYTSPLAPGPVPGGGSATHATLRHELWSANSNGTPNQLLETVAGLGHDQTGSFKTDNRAGTAYVYKPCVDTSGIPASEHAGRQYTLSAKALPRTGGNGERNEGPENISSGSKCFNFGFRPDNSGEVFTVILTEFGGNVSGQHTLKNTVTVRAR
jgi:hypothetical protein